MSLFALSLLPVISLIAIGYLLQRIDFLPGAAWAGLEKICYYLFFPALLIRTLGTQEINNAPWQAFFVMTFLVLALAGVLLWTYFRLSSRISNATFTSIFQGGVRYNTFVALSVAAAFYGEQGLQLVSINAGFMIVLINIMCVSVFSIYGSLATGKLKDSIKQIFINPLILGCVIGWCLSLSNIGLPGVTADILEIMGRAALPIGLLAVGAALKPKMIGGHSHAILVASFVQFFMKPAAIVALSFAFNLSPIATGVMLISFICPTASSSYILAKQLGGDAEAMTSIITAQTIAAFVAMPIWAALVLT